MSEVSERYATVADGFARRMAGVPDGKWAAPSPCEEWSARDVVIHVIDTHWRVRSAAGDVAPVEADPDGDLQAQWAAATGAIRGALADDELASKMTSGIFREQPFELLVGRLLCADTLIHTWDLARATGQDERVDEGASAVALEFLTPIDEAVRRPGGFGPKVEPPPDADVQTRLLAFSGRRV